MYILIASILEASYSTAIRLTDLLINNINKKNIEGRGGRTHSSVVYHHSPLVNRASSRGRSERELMHEVNMF